MIGIPISRDEMLNNNGQLVGGTTTVVKMVHFIMTTYRRTYESHKSIRKLVVGYQ